MPIFDDQLKSLKTLHVLLVLGLLLVASVIAYLVFAENEPMMNLPYLPTILFVFSLILVPASYLVSDIFFKRKLLLVQKVKEINQKMTVYRLAFIIRCSFLQVSGLFCLISAMLTGSKNLIFVGLIAILALASFHPSKSAIMKHIGQKST